MQRIDTHILESLGSGLVVYDREGVIVRANPNAEARLELDRGTLKGRNLKEFLVDVDAMTSPTPINARFRMGGNREREFWTSVSRLEGDYPSLRLMAICDVTELSSLKKERERLLQLAAVGAELPSVLHEVRNPLAAVMTKVELLIEEASPGLCQDDLFAILGEIRYVTKALQGFGTVGKTVRTAKYEAIDMAIEETALLLRPTATRSGVELDVRVEMMPLLALDQAVIRGIVVNLVNNAIQACSSGNKVKVRAGLKDKKALTIDVNDDGPGMAPDVLARCQELFFSSKRHGSGIGLALVTETVQGAGGSIEIKSEPGKGTQIHIEVPV